MVDKLKVAFSVGIGLAFMVMASAQESARLPVPVTIDNYNRAQTDVYFRLIATGGGFGKFLHARTLAPIDQHGIIRPNRDTLYSIAVFDLDAGAVTITLPDPGKRFMAMQVIDEDQYTKAVYYGAGTHSLDRDSIGTRYVCVVVRGLVDATNAVDLQQMHSLQDALKFSQKRPGSFEIPQWDEASRKKVQDALLQLGTTITDTHRMYGENKKAVDPVRHLVGSALLWGGNPEKDALYLPITPENNDGQTVYSLTVGYVPVDGFWSVTVYDREGYFQKNDYNAYSVNSNTAKKDTDGLTTIQFGGCANNIPNCLPITEGWNYTVRLFLPSKEVSMGSWKFPAITPAH
jgi:hypothetical protein